MTTADDLVTFLRARLDDDEEAARAATAGPWTTDDPTYPTRIVTESGIEVADSTGRDVTSLSYDDMGHVARHDPARVLREIDAKRRIIREYHSLRAAADYADRTSWSEYISDQDVDRSFGRALLLERVVRMLALPHADYPDYQENWRP